MSDKPGAKGAPAKTPSKAPPPKAPVSSRADLHEVTAFDKKKLKKTSTQIKNPLPTKEMIEDEKQNPVPEEPKTKKK